MRFTDEELEAGVTLTVAGHTYNLKLHRNAVGQAYILAQEVREYRHGLVLTGGCSFPVPREHRRSVTVEQLLAGMDHAKNGEHHSIIQERFLRRIRDRALFLESIQTMNKATRPRPKPTNCRRRKRWRRRK